MLATATAAQINDYQLKVGDTVITKDSETAEDMGLTAFVVAVLPNLLCGYHLAIVRPRQGVIPRWLTWSLRSSSSRAQLTVFSRGLTRVSLGQGYLRAVRVPTPPMDEQMIMASYLDQETSQMDTLISKKEQLIEKLLERRQALITQVVTKGLDPNVPMKDSGVEWLGEVPENWKIVRLARLVNFHSGRDMEKADFGPVPVYGSGGIFSWCEEPQNPSSSLSVLFGRKGTIDKPLLARGPFSCVDTMYWTSLSNDVEASFVYYLATCFPYAEIATQTALPSMTSSALKAVKVPLPNLHTQLDIISLLDRETSQIDILVEKTRRAIELLKERRQALITQVVTGKIDVRGFAGGNS
jgi:type I restriction enzyme S subunit